MQYLCVKQLTAGGTVYHPGEVIPDGVILLERSRKLIKSGYISKLDMEIPHESIHEQGKLFTESEVDAMIAYAVAETEKKREEQLAELQKYAAEPSTYDGTIQIVIKGVSEGENEQLTTLPAKADEIQQVFSIMQMGAEEGAKEITQVKSENVLILLYAADSRKTIRNAAKEQADKLFSVTEGAGG